MSGRTSRDIPSPSIHNLAPVCWIIIYLFACLFVYYIIIFAYTVTREHKYYLYFYFYSVHCYNTGTTAWVLLFVGYYNMRLKGQQKDFYHYYDAVLIIRCYILLHVFQKVFQDASNFWSCSSLGHAELYPPPTVQVPIAADQMLFWLTKTKT